MTYGHRDVQVARGIRRVRLERGWTLRDMAALLGCDPSRICRIENGERGTPDPAERQASSAYRCRT
jgi:transcriptional regulator with XRE-family HTH domain